MNMFAISAGFFLGISALSAQTVAPAATDTSTYTVIDLGQLNPGPGMRTMPRAIQNPTLAPSNLPPMVVGMSTDPAGRPRPFLWTTQWGMIDGIAGLSGVGEAHAVNQFGDYVGAFSPLSSSNTQQHAFLASTRMGAIHYLPTLGGLNAAAHGINDSMVIAGWSQTAQGHRHATIWSDMGTGPAGLGTFGGAHSAAFAINNAGQAVGHAQRIDGTFRAFLHDPQSPLPVLMMDLGSLWRDGASVARDINDSRIIVGSSQSRLAATTPNAQPIRRATMWIPSNVSMINLGALDPRDPASEALAVNNHRVAVGWSGRDPASLASNTSRLGQRAFIWEDGQIHDLNTLIPPNAGWVLLVAEDINDAGHIVGWGVRVNATSINHEVRGFLLIPQRS